MSQQDKHAQQRAQVPQRKRVVIKIGTHVLLDKHGQPNTRRIAGLVKQMAQLQKQGYRVILVSSGAIGVGLDTLGLKRRPSNLPDLQMAASVGQTRLQVIYEKYFAKYKLVTSQVLLTHDDLKNRTRHLNARHTLQALLNRGVVPIINENDVVAVDEIKFGDNDILSSLVCALVDADLLILLTTPDGLQEKVTARTLRRVPYVPKITDKTFALIHPGKQSLSTGGMQTKLLAAKNANKIGALTVMASGMQQHVLTDILQGKDVGTLFGQINAHQPIKKKRKQWIAFFNKPQGQVTINACAVQALRDQGKSLLPVGITGVAGNFTQGAVIEVVSEDKQVIAQGLCDYGSDEIERIKGKNTQDITLVLGYKFYDEVIHRNNLVIMHEEDDT